MATTAEKLDPSSARLNVLRVAVATAIAATLFLLLCWIGARIGLGPASHMYVNLFTNADVASTTALIVGICWSLFGGALIGALYALIYNALASLER